MWFSSLYTPIPRALCALSLGVVLLLAWPAAVGTAEDSDTATLAAPCSAGAGAAPPAIDVQLALTGEQVQATLTLPRSPLPAAGCVVPIPFQVPAAYRPPFALWRDVAGQALRADGTSDSVPLRLWIQPDGTLQYEVRMAELEAAELTYDLTLGWGTTAAANDQAVLHILMATLGMEPRREWEQAVHRDASGRVTELDWYRNHPFDYNYMWLGERVPKRVIHPPHVRVAWELPSELGQLTGLTRLALGGPLLTGSIPPELGQLAELERLTLVGSHLTGAVPPELGQLTQLQELELHRNQLTSLPPALGQLTQLVTLSLAGNRLTSLPPELGQLTQLHKLGVAGNQLTSLPPALGQLLNLEALDVQDNRLLALPSLAGLPNLEYLDVSGNRLTALPPDSLWPQREQDVPPASSPPQSFLVRLLQLMVRPVSPIVYLDLSGNQLTALPPELGQLRLRHLDVSDNQLTALPPELGQLRSPTYFPLPVIPFKHPLWLDLSGNRLTALPPELGQLTDSLGLDLSNNQLTVLPPELFQGTEMWLLDLSDNRLTAVPPVWSQFSTLSLRYLNLSGNQLTALPPELGQLTNLQRLYLAGNQLTAVPPELGQLTYLYTLDLAGNQLTAVPPELSQLTSLFALNLSGNQLVSLESSAQYLQSHYQYLDLSDNPLTALPSSLPSSFTVDHLDLSNTTLTTLLPAKGRSLQLMPRISLALRRHQLTDLAADLAWLAQGPFPPTRLDLSDNQLTTLPASLAQFPKLTHLDLSDNQLTTLPASLAQFPKLTHLDLSDNQLSGSLSELGPLPPLLSLDLRGNPLVTCLLPLPWRVARYIYPPDYTLYIDLDHWLLSPPPNTNTEPPDLPFWELCPE